MLTSNNWSNGISSKQAWKDSSMSEPVSFNCGPTQYNYLDFKFNLRTFWSVKYTWVQQQIGSVNQKQQEH